jgi:N-methylhydantoinase A
VKERIKWDGTVVTPLDEEQVREACRYLLGHGVEAVVVGFIWSFRNPEHEKRAIDICREEMPGVYVIGSCDIQPEIREYWRISTAVLSAYVGPALSHYLTHMVQTLEEYGFGGQLLITQSNAGVMFPEIAMEQAARTLLSGPACAPAAAAYIASPLNLKNLITCDMGGTSFDVALIKNEKPATTLETAVGGVYHLRLPMVDVHTIGSGGGSIGWLDAMKVLHMGPASAGADPGPACYGRGGTEPTSTDADVVLGYLDPDYFLGGKMSIDKSLAEKAIKEKIADPLSIDVVEAAKAMRKIIDHSMSDAISEVSVQKGEDPRRYALVAAGGAGPVHIADLARVLNIKQILVPRNSSIFCAIGSIIADLRHDLVTSVITRTGEADVDFLNRAFLEMKETSDGYLEREGIAEKDKYYRKSIDMRYMGQFHEVELPISEALLSKEELEFVVRDFHKKHEELYAYSEPDSQTEMINLRLAAFGKVVPPARKTRDGKESMDASRFVIGQRKVYFEEKFGFVRTFVYDGDALEVGNIIEGPAIVEQSTTTLVVPPDARLDVTEYGDFVMTLA